MTLAAELPAKFAVTRPVKIENTAEIRTPASPIRAPCRALGAAACLASTDGAGAACILNGRWDADPAATFLNRDNLLGGVGPDMYNILAAAILFQHHSAK